ncbi:Signal transduction histidine-protein kinase BarA [bacterium HR36]|nr:Signal transduction histidine-protein kinase BarA [bacterium HR36]
MSRARMSGEAGKLPLRRREWIGLAVLLLLGLVASGLAAWGVRHLEEQQFWTQFERQCWQWQVPVQDRLDRALALLAALQDFFAASDLVEAEEFHRFVQRSVQRNAGLRLVAWAPKILAEKWPEWRRQALEVGQLDRSFELRDARHRPYLPSSPQEEVWPLTYIAPAEASTCLGVNLASYERWPIMAASLSSPDALLEWISVVPDPVDSSRLHLVFLAPVESRQLSRNQTPSRLQQGVALVVMDVPKTVEDCLKNAVPSTVQVSLVAEGEEPPAAPVVLYRRLAEEPGGTLLTEKRVTCRLEGPNDLWLEFTPTAPYAGSFTAWGSWLTLGLCLAVVGLAEAGVISAARRRARVEALVRERTAELERANRDLAEEVRRRSEITSELFRHQQLLDGIVENSPAVIYAKDLQGSYLFINARYSELFGVQPQEIIGRTDADIFPAEFASKFQENDRQVLARGEALVFEEVAPHPDGPHTYVSVKFPIRNQQGQAVAVCGISTDITERKRAEIALRDSEALYHSLVECVPLCILRKDREGRFTFANQKFCQMLGRSTEEILGKTDYDFFPPQLADKYRRDDRWVLETGEIFEDVEEHQTPAREKLFVQVIKSPVRDAAGNIVEVQCMFVDVTERKRAEEALRKAREAAEAANRAKSDFLANMSHEIRTPLNAVIGLTELLLQTPINDLQREYLQMILESGELLLALINDVLDFSKIEAGKLELDHRPFDLWEQMGDTVKLLAARASQKGLELACDIAADVPGVVVGDAGRLRQVLLNLLSNAIKFTEHGEVVVQVRCQERQNDHALLLFSVRDTGIGIPRDKQERIFQAFEQVDTSTTRRYGGTGLGLAIASKLVGLMGGRIWVESEPGQGSTFYFTARLEVAKSQYRMEPQTQLESLRNLRVLVVDDSATNRTILEKMLQSWNMLTVCAGDADTALQQLAQARLAGQPFELVITDAAMPGRDGFQLIEAIRQQETSPPVILLLTSADHPDLLARCVELGLTRWLIKPIKQSELLEAILDSFHLRPAETTESASPSLDKTQPQVAMSSASLRVLLVEDSVVNQRLMQGLLGGWGHEVVVAENGQQALQWFSRERFDLIIMDIQMPGMDGYEVMRRIRSMERRRGGHVPILAITARAMRDDRQKCLDAGADGYLAKPIRAAELAAEMARVLGLASTPSRISTSGTRALASETSTLPIQINWSEALASTRGDWELLRQVVEAFMSEARLLVEQARQALSQRDASTLKRLAHTLAGNLRLFGVHTVSEIARALQDAAERQDWPRADAAFYQLAPLLEQVFAQLQALPIQAP